MAMVKKQVDQTLDNLVKNIYDEGDKFRRNNNNRRTLIQCPTISMFLVGLIVVTCPLMTNVHAASVVSTATDLFGGVISDVRTLTREKSPYRVTGHVVIEREGQVLIEPGVELQFVAGVGMTIRGILKAEGRENGVIRFTRFTTKLNDVVRAAADIRLVDGPSIHEGRLQLLYKGKWRSVCTNSRNWTATDFQVACRQLGFLGGSFSRWFPRNNDSSQLLYERPGCSSSSSSASLVSCNNWAARQLGSGVCDLHYDMGIHCEPQSLRPLEHWAGLRFEDSHYYYNAMLQRSTSRSSLRHVEVLYAGWNATANFTAAIETLGVPPEIDRVTVKWSAYTGVNVTRPATEFEITNCLVSDNRGYGIYVNSSTGLARVANTAVLSNGADGIRYVVHHPWLPLFGADAVDFCGYAERGSSQLYPLVLNAVQERSDSPNARKCSKVFYVDRGRAQVLTLNFAYLESSAEGGGTVEARDGSYESSPLLLRFDVRNGTRPQSVTTTGTALFISFAPAARHYVVVSMEILSHRDKAYDLNVTGSTVRGNNGRGIAVEHLRSMLHVVSSHVSLNTHVAGVHVRGGAGDVNLTRTELSENAGDGVNVTYAGGRRNLTACNVMRNRGRGVAVWLNETSRAVAATQYTVVAYSTFVANRDVGLLVGNFCRPSVLNVTYVVFDASERASLRADVCWRRAVDDDEPVPLTTVYVTHCRFSRQRNQPALVVSPAANVRAVVAHNRFAENEAGALVVRSPPDDDNVVLETLPAAVDIHDNVFENNSGAFVAAIGLSQYSLVQRLSFERNELTRNRVSEPFGGGLAPRLRVAAVVVVSSSTNVRLHRNLFQNNESRYEIGSHLRDRYATVNATHCYFGKYGDTHALLVYDRVFDAKDRYDLAAIVVTPYLMVPYKDETRLVSLDQSNQLVVDFQPDGSGRRLGGTVYGRQELAEGDYVVWRDIYVRAQSELVLSRRTTLRFAPSVGMMVQGRLTVRGEKHDDTRRVLMTLGTPADDNQAALPPLQAPTDPPVRLVGGSGIGGGDVRDGVLQVRVAGDRWGTVCAYGWNRHGAALACAAMGFVLRPDDWTGPRRRPDGDQAAAAAVPVLLSNVRCTEFDVDLLRCRAEAADDDFEAGACGRAGVVRLRCYRQTWAGLRLGPMADPSDLRALRIERAGVLDAATGLFRPALQLDLNRHRLEDVTVAQSLDAGIGVVFNDFYADAGARRLAGCVLDGNLGSGIVTRTSGLRVDACLLRSNRGHGLLYAPTLDHAEQRELGRWLDRSDTTNVEILRPSSVNDSSSSSSPATRTLGRGSGLYVVLDSRSPSSSVAAVASLRIVTDVDNVFGLQLLAPLHDGVDDHARVRDGTSGRSWDVRRDEPDFPTVTMHNEIEVTYTRPAPHSHGDAVVYVVAVERRPVHPPPGPVPTLRLADSDVRHNRGAGLAAVHYSAQVGPQEQRRLRVRNESVEVVRCRFVDNAGPAIRVRSVPADDEQRDEGNATWAAFANVTYSVNGSEVAGGGGGVVMQQQDDDDDDDDGGGVGGGRGGNNVFHWILADNVFHENVRGGLEVTMPYVRQYDRRRHHTVFMRNNTFRDNRNFGLTFDGHYARVEARWNWFYDNRCFRGLWQIKGMEKELLMTENSLERNRCEFLVQFWADSHTEKFGRVDATFSKNRLYDNAFGSNDTTTTSPVPGGAVPTYRPRSYTVAVRGVQKVNVTDNLFTNNSLDYEFLAGVVSGSLASRLDVRRNWWGTASAPDIRRRIFDFDDWNSFAVADFSPFLQFDKLDAPLAPEVVATGSRPGDDDRFLGGRMHDSVVLRRRRGDLPYVVRSDLTVMPGATLHIEAGVELQFYPSVGILVLGALRAMGHAGRPIVMRPFALPPLVVVPPSFYPGRTPGEPLVRLCAGGECGGPHRQGFLELFNATTRQWVPACDPHFSERNAEVVCRECGYDAADAHVLRGPRLRPELDRNLVSKVVHWPEPRLCSGRESRYSECPRRRIGGGGGSTPLTFPCAPDALTFVFVYCGQRDLLGPGVAGYWGGVRFALPAFEPLEDRAYDTVADNMVLVDNSALEHVTVEGAGVLHGDRSPAVLAVGRAPRTLEYLNVSRCAWDGVALLALGGGGNVNVYGGRVHGNLGVGVRVGVLAGESRSSATSSFAPLDAVTVPRDVFGMADACSSDKLLDVRRRVLLYYSYDERAADCVKIFRSRPRSRSVGFRLLQFGLLNTTGLTPATPDSITLLDGDLYDDDGGHDRPPPVLAVLTTESEPDFRRRFFTTKGPALTVRIHASGGAATLGFVAEVVTVPAVSTVVRDVHHNVTNCVVSGNVRGGVVYDSVGEMGASVAVQLSQFRDNGLSLFGNFSTSTAAVRADVQNTARLLVQNNLFIHNQGGLDVVADSETSAAATNAFVVNNLFFRNEKWPALAVRGRKATPYQSADVFRNAVTQNDAPYHDVVVLRRVVTNFSENVVANNTGDHIVSAVAFDQASTPDFQVFKYNSFWNNWALRWDERSTIMLYGAGQRIEENVLLDPYNDFELMVRNLSGSDDEVVDTRSIARIDATNNWWGYNQSQAVSGRIWDGADDDGLVHVVHRPFYINNATLLSGKCPPGWQMIRNTCFLYVGGTMEFDQAESYCETINGSIPYVEDSVIGDVATFVARKQVNYDVRTYRTWIRTLGTPLRGCSSLLGLNTWDTPCDTRLPFLCETDPDVHLDPGDWLKYTVTYSALGAVAATLVLVLLCVVFWLCKSRRRHLEKMERRNSIRSSLRSASSRSLTMGSTSSGLGDGLAYKRKMLVEPLKLSDVVIKRSVDDSVSGSVDSIAKNGVGGGSRFGSSSSSSAFNSSIEDNRSYDIVEAKNHRMDYSDYDEKYVTEAHPPPPPPPVVAAAATRYYNDGDATPPSVLDYGYDNKGYLETHFTSEETGSASTASSTVDDPFDFKRQLELGRQRLSGSYGSRSTPSTSSQEYPYRRQLLETEM